MSVNVLKEEEKFDFMFCVGISDLVARKSQLFLYFIFVWLRRKPSKGRECRFLLCFSWLRKSNLMGH